MGWFWVTLCKSKAVQVVPLTDAPEGGVCKPGKKWQKSSISISKWKISTGDPCARLGGSGSAENYLAGHGPDHDDHGGDTSHVH